MEDADSVFGGNDEDDLDLLEAVERVEVVSRGAGPSQDHLACLKKYFGHSTFKTLQWNIIDSLMSRKQDQLAIMATGYGKSLLYQVSQSVNPAVVNSCYSIASIVRLLFYCTYTSLYIPGLS